MADPGDGALQVLSFGCRLNAHEGEAARERAVNDGLTDGVIVNTCAVTSEAVRQARQAIRKARRERPGARIIATGCAAQIDPGGFAAMPEVDLVLGNGLKTRPGSYAPAAFKTRVQVEDLFDPSAILAAAAPAPRAGRSRGYVEVQNGCDHRCTFCVIPFGRGASRSRPLKDVVADVRRLVDTGTREVVLTGVDLTSYGQDPGAELSLGGLAKAILAEVSDLKRLRLSSIDAAEIDPVLVDLIASEPRLMPHLHLSLQSGSDMILKRMKRRHLRGDALSLIETVRRLRPETAFGADLIAGFPTETPAMFEDSLALIDDAGLSYVHVFPYSPRPGTPAARMPPVERGEVKARAARLRAAGDAALDRHLAQRVGRTLEGLVEAPGRARAEDFTELVFEGDADVGAILSLRVVGRAMGRALSEPSADIHESVIPTV